MTKFIRVTFNGRILCGSDFAFPIAPGMGSKAIENRRNLLLQNAEKLKAIKPYLNDGKISTVIE